MHRNTEVSYVLSLIQVIKDVTLSLFCCTEGEAARFGTADYFLLCVCDDLTAAISIQRRIFE